MNNISFKQSLAQLLHGFSAALVDPDIMVSHLVVDSREVCPESVFFAYPGEHGDGREHMHQAIEQGAVAIVYEGGGCGDISVSVPAVPVVNLQQKLGEIAAQFYGYPSRELTIVGVTGTNGKTSVTQFLAQALSARKKVAVVGTLGAGIWPALRKTGYTTPDAIQLQAFLAECCEQQVDVVAMEVSSHALIQGRVNGVHFDVAVFTNLSHDHLDYHQDMQQYAAAKALLFQMPGLRYAVFNLDDPVGMQWSQDYKQQLEVFCFAISNARAGGNVATANAITVTDQGFSFELQLAEERAMAHVSLLGEFNISNLLAVSVVLKLLAYTMDQTIEAIHAIQPVDGRMQWLTAAHKPNVVIDFAHTPDALAQALRSCRQHCGGKLWCVFGCGGDRDRQKRPLMGKVAEQLSDAIIITNDNPRTESPELIAADISSSIASADIKIILDRAEAIEYALAHAKVNDWVLVAGKGHESQQIIGKDQIPFSDIEQVTKQLQRGVA